MTQLEMTTSKESLGRGMDSISPLTNSTLATPRAAWFLRASSSISGVMSSPVTRPASPTCCAARKQSMPPPEPRSSTLSPGWSPARAVGLPHPAEAASDSMGRPSIWPSVYSRMACSRSSGAQQEEAAGSQQLPPAWLFSPCSTTGPGSDDPPGVGSIPFPDLFLYIVLFSDHLLASPFFLESSSPAPDHLPAAQSGG